MTIWEKSLLLILLRRELETERDIDWQTLHRRDRSWALEQPAQSAWTLLRCWLLQRRAFSGAGLFVYFASAVAFIIGCSLMAGLLAYQPFQRINLLWLLLLGVLLPFLWWLLALFFSAAQVPFPLRSLYEHRLPGGPVPAPLRPLLKQTVLVLGQQLSLLFALGMLLAFLLYLLVTDLAFGWSSTLEPGGGTIHQLTSFLAWPWQALWPAAVPSIELIEQTHYFRAAPLTATDPALFGQWWRFLLMCLLCYLLLPRLVSWLVMRLRLGRLQERVRADDALVSGLWQRLSSELIEQETEPVEQHRSESVAAEGESFSGSFTQVICWGSWPAELIERVRRQLNVGPAGLQWLDADSGTDAATIDRFLGPLPDQPLLLLCKGWEPPTGEVADLCELLARRRGRLFLWPVPLQGMEGTRQQRLLHSWQSFMGRIPDRFHLVALPMAGEVASE
ncbi:MAG: DUF2868 domain-containing protein [Sedimenticola sp.]|nr:DUF2868 domain-containing protein [Sedimenticola sp.]